MRILNTYFFLKHHNIKKQTTQPGLHYFNYKIKKKNTSVKKPSQKNKNIPSQKKYVSVKQYHHPPKF